MGKLNNVKGMVWREISCSNRPITVTDIVEKLDSVAPHSIYGAFESLKADGLVVRFRSHSRLMYQRSDLPSAINRIVSLLQANKNYGFRAEEIASSLSLTRKAISKPLAQLVLDGWINSIGGNRFTLYFYGELLDSTCHYQCKKCGNRTLHLGWGNGRIKCNECGTRRRVQYEI